jgi:cell division protein FtsB
MLRLAIMLLLILVLVLQGMLWFSDDGIRKVRQLEAAVTEQREDNQRLETRNQNLQAEVEDLRVRLEAIEERARTDLGLIREGETFYQVITPEEQPQQEQRP